MRNDIELENVLVLDETSIGILHSLLVMEVEIEKVKAAAMETANSECLINGKVPKYEAKHFAAIAKNMKSTKDQLTSLAKVAVDNARAKAEYMQYDGPMERH